MRNMFKVAGLAAGLLVGGMGLSASAATSTTATVATSDVGYSWTVNLICSAAMP